MEPITTTKELAEACERPAPLRDRRHRVPARETYYPMLCVVQLASTDEAVVVDALAPRASTSRRSSR